MLARHFLRSIVLWYAQNFHWVQNSIFPQLKTLFSQSIDKFLKFEDIGYLIHYLASLVYVPPSYFQQ